MVKTRIQTSSNTIKKEEDCKNTQLLNTVSNGTKSKNKITKRKTQNNKNKVLPIAEVKLEDKIDKKYLLQAPSNPRGRNPITETQFKQLISYINNDNMSMSAASKKLNLCYSTALLYYKRYKKNPKTDLFTHKQTPKRYTYQDIKTLIGYIVDDGMSITDASIKAKITSTSAYAYYRKYSQDPNHGIPIPYNQQKSGSKTCTQDQIKMLIDYIANDNMSIYDASIKANMCVGTGKKYYYQYMNDPNHEIPISINKSGIPYTQEKTKELIGYLVNDKMDIYAAALKAKMSVYSARRKYRQYLNDPNREIPKIEKDQRHTCRQEKIKELIDYIVNDGISMEVASVKAKMSIAAARKYYHQYLNDPKHEIPTPLPYHGKRCTQDQIRQLIGYLENESMSLEAASAKSKMSQATARKYYCQYLNDPNQQIPVPINNTGHYITQEQIKELINCIVDDKMTLVSASIKSKMSLYTAKKYYGLYLVDPNHQIPMHTKNTGNPTTQERITEVIGYIVNDNMSVPVAAEKAKMDVRTARKYYRKYLNDPDFKMIHTNK